MRHKDLNVFTVLAKLTQISQFNNGVFWRLIDSYGDSYEAPKIN